MFLAACSSNGGGGSSAGGAGAPGSGGSTSSTGGSGGGTEADAGLTNDCSGQLSGPIVGTIDFCVYTTSIETNPSTGAVVKVTHGFVAEAGDNQVTVVFSFKQEPPTAGTYDSANLADYQATVGLLLYGASFDARFPSQTEGSMTLNLSAVNGSTLTGTLDAEMPPQIATLTDAGPGSAILHLAFP